MLICYESYMEGVPNAPELSMFFVSLSFLKNVFRLGRCKFARLLLLQRESSVLFGFEKAEVK